MALFRIWPELTIWSHRRNQPFLAPFWRGYNHRYCGVYHICKGGAKHCWLSGRYLLIPPQRRCPAIWGAGSCPKGVPKWVPWASWHPSIRGHFLFYARARAYTVGFIERGGADPRDPGVPGPPRGVPPRHPPPRRGPPPGLAPRPLAHRPHLPRARGRRSVRSTLPCAPTGRTSTAPRGAAPPRTSLPSPRRCVPPVPHSLRPRAVQRHRVPHSFPPPAAGAPLGVPYLKDDMLIALPSVLHTCYHARCRRSVRSTSP